MRERDRDRERQREIERERRRQATEAGEVVFSQVHARGVCMRVWAQS